ncbi:cytochrome ubiquinol oxidase subunit I [Methylomicrobium album]|uniref:Cytochrome bd-type quinol oxidase, subunit 1 n=1 Tax=Methylomicrobium album BG8 TaxID=686340 RepID=H8GMJ8_METAL|nr:cytochrome ubiquinol oxidase subunit I [Methylomicrobium album]EIC28238.1 cytochrome bd-type quinol oxidase, subunit 1 [Methylomicrobium album BG8]
MIVDEVVELSRLQFALTAMYHFLFVPLTLGLSFLLAIMESVYVMTGRLIYKDMTRFWGKLFAINFAMGIMTGITLEFQFGTNWAYYSHYVGDIFGVPLAIEGMMAFFLESTFVGLFFFGWDKLGKLQHLCTTWLLALGTSLSALWILIANAWMQHPVGAAFNYDRMRMELSSFEDLFFSPVAQVKFVHTVAAGYVTGSMFVLGISAYYLLKDRDSAFARRSFRIAAGFGLASVLSVIVLGDESGYTVGEVQKVKLAAIEAEWETEKPPASFTLIGFPNEETMHTDYAVKFPWVMGLIATRSVDEPVLGLKEILNTNRERIKNGIIAYENLQIIRQDKNNAAAKALFETHKADLGYGLLLKRYAPNVVDATEEQIETATRRSVPKVAPIFWSFRIMVFCGVAMLFIFAAAFYFNAKHTAHAQRWLLRLAFYGIPLPWIASELGWVVAEYGRQPWTIAEILPTHLSSSSLSAEQLYLSLAGFGFFYTVLLVIELFLMVKYIRQGPSSLHTGRYHFEREQGHA